VITSPAQARKACHVPVIITSDLDGGCAYDSDKR
jgi:hypothetical protein